MPDYVLYGIVRGSHTPTSIYSSDWATSLLDSPILAVTVGTNAVSLDEERLVPSPSSTNELIEGWPSGHQQYNHCEFILFIYTAKMFILIHV